MGGGRAEPTPGGQGVSPCRGAALGGGRDAGGEAAKRPFSPAPSGGLLSYFPGSLKSYSQPTGIK